MLCSILTSNNIESHHVEIGLRKYQTRLDQMKVVVFNKEYSDFEKIMSNEQTFSETASASSAISSSLLQFHAHCSFVASFGGSSCCVYCCFCFCCGCIYIFVVVVVVVVFCSFFALLVDNAAIVQTLP